MSSNNFISALKTQYTGVRNVLGSYWAIYGGLIVLLASPYLHAALVLTTFTWGLWSNKDWWDIPIAVLPNLISFTLAGYAMLIGFGDTAFKKLLADDISKKSVLLGLSAAFAHFLIVQTFALLLALVAKSRPFSTIMALFPNLIDNQIITDIRPICGNFGWYLGFATFLYAITSIVSVTFSVFRTTRWFNTFLAGELSKDARSGRK